MIITINCPDCSKEIKIDIPAVDRWKARALSAETKVSNLQRRIHELEKEAAGIAGLEKLFGGFGK